LADRGHDIAVLSYDQPGGDSFYSLNPKVKRIELGLGSTTDRATVLDTLRRVAVLRTSVRGYSPDVVIGFMHSMFIPLGLSLVGTSIPMIASEHIVPEHYRSRPLEGMLLRLVPLLADRITCVSEQVRSSYPSFLQKKMVAIANPISVSVCGKVDVSGQQKHRKILLTVGRLDPQKDHATLIEAFGEIAGQFPGWDLRIIGDGELRPKLESKVAEFGLSERVFLPGTIKDIATEYLSAQLFVQPSRYESFGLTTAEALAHGLPAVGFDDCQGTNQLIRPGINGSLADGSDNRVAALAKTLKTLMKDDALRIRLSKHSDDTLHECRLENVLSHWEQIFFNVKGIGL
jgi:glycosyltransferase involved in cell wall biosynthesis